MSKSLTYHLVLLVLRLKGIKQKFGRDPVDVAGLRGEDVHHPKGRSFRGPGVRRFTVLGSQVTERKGTAQGLVLMIPGGAFVSGPAQHHWDALAKLAQRTGHTVWLVDYPKAPEHHIAEICANIDAVWALARQQVALEHITLLGDSAGGSLAISCTQRAIAAQGATAGKLVLVSPMVDASFENPLIEAVEPRDPMLSRKGALSAKRMCAGPLPLKDPMLSPLYGDLRHFPETTLFLAEDDITYPDQLLFVAKLKQCAVPHTVIVGQGMPHIWPLLPVMKEARQAFERLVGVVAGSA